MEVTKEKFSQGEWSACCLDAKPHFVFAGEKTVCTMLCNDKTMPDYEPMEAEVTLDECVANAKLIQSAPELFKALEDAINMIIYLGRNDSPIVQNGLRIIAKTRE